MWTQAIQITDTTKNVYEALALLDALRIQVGHVASRVLHPCAVKPEWRVQAIMETNGEFPHGWLPDGMKHYALCASRDRVGILTMIFANWLYLAGFSPMRP